jgi:hypothetical protein
MPSVASYSMETQAGHAGNFGNRHDITSAGKMPALAISRAWVGQFVDHRIHMF